MTLTPEVMAIATAQAARDRDILARLIVEGKVERGDGGRRAFVDDITARVNAATGRRTVNLAIRPKRKKGKR